MGARVYGCVHVVSCQIESSRRQMTLSVRIERGWVGRVGKLGRLGWVGQALYAPRGQDKTRSPTTVRMRAMASLHRTFVCDGIQGMVVVGLIWIGGKVGVWRGKRGQGKRGPGWVGDRGSREWRAVGSGVNRSTLATVNGVRSESSWCCIDARLMLVVRGYAVTRGGLSLSPPNAARARRYSSTTPCT